ncbi:MAG: threonine synthase [Rikenellaceae bacterium]|nr:threonine synthase [Rikenellaceae bacterium]
MRYKTTRGSKESYSLKEAAFMGLAPDGGLFMPESVPQVDMDEVAERAESSFADMGEYLAGLYFGGDVPREELRGAVEAAFSFPVPLKHIGDELRTLELFHGPTAAFKDFGAGFMGQMLGRLRQDDEKLTILTATSGDTGSAVAHGFYNVPGIEVIILYPDGKISDLQESQMTTLGGNIHALRIEGTFDDCQRMVKEVFSDAAYRKTRNVTSANSINLLRWIPQSFYYFYGWKLWRDATGGERPDIVVPSGNYGNLSAGMLAQRMGLPVGRFIAASNANDVIPEFLQTGVYRPRPSVQTIANAMDVGNPSNYERMVALAGGSEEVLRTEIEGFASTDQQIRSAIKDIYDRYGYISDPHSATGYNAAKHFDAKGFWLSTAHAAKFGEVIESTLGIAPAIPERLAKLLGRPKVSTPMAADSALLKEFVNYKL